MAVLLVKRRCASPAMPSCSRLPGAAALLHADRENGYDILPDQGATLFDFKESSHWIWSNELGRFDRPRRGEEPFILLLGESAWDTKLWRKCGAVSWRARPVPES